MSQQTILADLIHAYGGPNPGAGSDFGDSWETVVTKINAMFTELYSTYAWDHDARSFKVIQNSSADQTTNLQNWINACVADGVTGYLPASTKYLHSGLTVAGPCRLIGDGKQFSILSLASNINVSGIKVLPWVNTGQQNVCIERIQIDGNKAGNSTGHGVEASDDSGGGYGLSVKLLDVLVQNAPQYGVYSGTNRNECMLHRTTLQGNGSDGWYNIASDSRSFFTDAKNNGGNGFHIHDGADAYMFGCTGTGNSLAGLLCDRASSDPAIHFILGNLSGNVQNGLKVDTNNIYVANSFLNTRFSGNSAAPSSPGTYSDILLSRTSGTIIGTPKFVKTSPQSKYLIETSSPHGPIVLYNPTWDAANLPYTTDLTNDYVNVPFNSLTFANGAQVITGSGSPAGVVSANIGSIFLRRDGGASTTLYVKESGAGTSTGWVAK